MDKRIPDRRRQAKSGQTFNTSGNVNRSPRGAPVIALSKIDIGQPDANAEYFLAQQAKIEPMYLRAFYDWEGIPTENLEGGSKFILYGQKGTGKTALLRYLKHKCDENYNTSFVIFRKEIIEEAQLASLQSTFSASAVVDEEKLKDAKFYYHAMKRLLLTLVLSHANSIEDCPDEQSWFGKLFADIKKSSAGQVASLVTDSVVGSLEAVQVDVDKATNGILKVNPAKAIKRSNDAFQKFAYQKISEKNLKVRIFLDEMHFAYRDTDALSADASLVRDTILAVREINERFIESGIDCLIYISVRSEFLEHQEIAVADVSHTIESYGIELSWESAPYNKGHPMFDLMLRRLQVAIDPRLTKDEMFRRYIPVSDIKDFLELTWGKPRDIVRYFKAASLSYPNSGSISKGSAFANVMRRYGQAAWQDQKAALAAFVPKDSLPKVQDALQRIARSNLDSSKNFTLALLKQDFEKAFEDMCARGVSYDINEFIDLLYIIGIFYVGYRDKNGQFIIHQFHRGNRHYFKDGNFFVHRAIARAFS